MTFSDLTIHCIIAPLRYNISYFINDFATATDTCFLTYSQEILTGKVLLFPIQGKLVPSCPTPSRLVGIAEVVGW